MTAIAHALPRIPQVPRAYADFLFQGLTRSGCIKDRNRAYGWLLARTRDTAQLDCFMNALFPKG